MERLPQDGIFILTLVFAVSVRFQETNAIESHYCPGTETHFVDVLQRREIPCAEAKDPLLILQGWRLELGVSSLDNIGTKKCFVTRVVREEQKKAILVCCHGYEGVFCETRIENELSFFKPLVEKRSADSNNYGNRSMTTASPALEALDLSSRSYATCLSWSRDHFRTFDGMDFSFEGACTYTLAAGTDGTWDATLKRDNCDTLDTCYKKLELILGMDVVTADGTNVFINDKKLNSFPFLDNGISIKRVGDFTYLESGLGVLAKWDGSMMIELTVLAELRHSTLGLCGTFDDDPSNDMTTRSGEVAGNQIQFAASWEAPGPGEVCPPLSEVHPCIVNGNLMETAQSLCSVLELAEDFQACHSVVQTANQAS
ncbi:SCO-spondin-like [Asterias amurensis]|uniref:SCO-spondin-like n=1 Tax=Asterias amurensis TaxID=7602 RepID=UPI003AB40C7E